MTARAKLLLHGIFTSHLRQLILRPSGLLVKGAIVDHPGATVGLTVIDDVVYGIVSLEAGGTSIMEGVDEIFTVGSDAGTIVGDGVSDGIGCWETSAVQRNVKCARLYRRGVRVNHHVLYAFVYEKRVEYTTLKDVYDFEGGYTTRWQNER